MFLAAPATATVRHVPDDYATIQAALDAASSGDTVLVAPGTYSGTGNQGLAWFDKDLHLISESGPEVTTIQCIGAGPGISSTGGTSASMIAGFTIRDGNSDYAGGINCGNAPLIRDCVIENCSGLQGAIRIQGDEPTTILRCTIRNCRSDYDAVLNINTEGHIKVTDCTIVDNETGNEWDEIDSSGGGVLAWNFTLERCTIARNSAHGQGGAVMGLDGQIIDCEIYGNEASLGGGGLLIWNCSVSDSRIAGNRSGEGGGGVLAGGMFEMESCIVTGNRSGTIGGGLYLATDPVSTIRQSSISSNYCEGDGGFPFGGGGIYLDDLSGILLDRTILRGNCSPLGADEASLAFGSKATFFCCAFDPSAVGGPGETHLTGDQVFADPLFCESIDCELAPTDLGDFTLDAFSPCLPGQSPCGELIGALPLGCGDPAGLPDGASVEETTWGALKAGYR